MDNKTLIDTVSRRSGINKKETANLLEAMVGAITNICSNSDSVAVPGFGTFEPKKRAERIMAVPSTGRRLLLPPKISLVFRASAMLKQQLRNPEK